MGEIADLQRKFRVLENDKRAYSEDSQGIIRKQRATIEKLTRENRKMKQEVNETRATSGGRAEHKMGAERAARLTEKKEEIEKKLKDEVESLKLTESRIDAKHKELKQIRVDLGALGGIEAEA